MSSTDTLTGLYNRFRIDESLEENLQIFKRYNKYFSVIILDIDDFKVVNDTFGHQTGDKILKEFSQVLKKNIRSVDILGRWGGEEFLIISTETNVDEAIKIAEKLKDKIENHTFSKIKTITSSFGVSQISPNDTIRAIIKRADSALYTSKHEGKNRVTCR